MNAFYIVFYDADHHHRRRRHAAKQHAVLEVKLVKVKHTNLMKIKINIRME